MGSYSEVPEFRVETMNYRDTRTRSKNWKHTEPK